MSESKVIKKEQCPECKLEGADNSEDNLQIYEDGGKHCFRCGYNTKQQTALTKKQSIFIEGEIHELRTRGLTYATCNHFDYRIGQDKAKIWVQIANYYDNKGTKIAQKLRYPTDEETGKKEFIILGKGSNLPLYGSWLYQPTDKLFITIVEGELDCLSVAQAQGYQYPIISLSTGAGSAYKQLQSNLHYLLGFKYVVLAFDNDEAGLKAALQCAPLFEPGMVRIAKWPLKDANEMIMAGKASDIYKTIFNAQIFAPRSITGVKDIVSKVLIQPQTGKPYPWPSLTDITYGYQLEEITIIVGANGIGKTEYVKDMIFHFLESDIKVGLFSFEQTPESTIRRLVGSKLGLKLHLPGAKWEPELIKQVALEFNDKLWLYDKPGSADDAELIHSIRFLAKAKQVKVFIIDNLKGLGGNKDLERMENMMRKLQAMKQELGISFYLLSHVAKDKYNSQVYVSTAKRNEEHYESQTADDINTIIQRPGMTWESGRIPTKENVEGASAICDLADYVFALSRNTTSNDDNESRTLKIKCLKSRLDGSKTGKIFKLYYTDLGKLEEIGGSANKHGEY